MATPATHSMSRHPNTVEHVEITEEHTEPSAKELELKAQEQQLTKVQTLRRSSDWFEAVPYSYMTPSALEHSLTAHSLRGPFKILRRPLKFFNKDRTKCVLIVHLGDQLCDGNVIHNGLIATLLDEHLAFVTLPSLPNQTGFTANLNVDYHQSITPNQWIIVEGVLDRIEGRKAYADAWIENTDGIRMAEARALYISPKQ